MRKLTLISYYLNSALKSPFRISIKVILLGNTTHKYDDVELEILPMLIEVFLRHLFFCKRKTFYGDDYSKINELINYKSNLISRFNSLTEKAIVIGSKELFLKKWKLLLDRKESLNIHFG